MGKLILNGVTFNATEVNRKQPNYGTVIRAANGKPHYMKRSTTAKRTFTFTFDLTPSEVTALAAIANLATTFPMVHPNGTTYTVQNNLDGMEDSLSGEDSMPSGDIYVGTLTVDEA